MRICILYKTDRNERKINLINVFIQKIIINNFNKKVIMEYTMPYKSKLLIDLFINKKKHIIINPNVITSINKKVTFNIFNEIEIIPNCNKNDYPDLWWSRSDLYIINQNAYCELRDFTKHNPSVNIKNARKILYQPINR